MKKTSVLLVGIMYSVFSFAQETDQLKSDFHRQKREELRKLLPEKSVAVFFSNKMHKRSNDVSFEFHQDPNFFYLTGLKETNAVLLVFKEMQKIDSVEANEVLIVQPRNPLMETWTGIRMGAQGAKKELGFIVSYDGCEFSLSKLSFKRFDKVLYNNLPDKQEKEGYKCHELEYLAAEIVERTGIKKKEEELPEKEKIGVLKGMMAKLRELKSAEELALMRKAIDITCDGLKEVIRSTKPGDAEYTAESTAEYVFKKSGAEDVGYPSIAGSGANTCILHYETNRNTLQAGDLLVADMGAEYRGYTADVTRTIPVNGKYTEEQKIIYNIVLEAQLEGIKRCKADSAFKAPHWAAVNVIKKRLLEYRIIQSESEYNLYFMHGTSHYLGLDVHDAGMYGALKPDNVITVEPGLYIKAGSACDKKWWNIGVRIEDDILITEGEPEVLSSCLPKTVEEIELLMKQEPVFVK